MAPELGRRRKVMVCTKELTGLVGLDQTGRFPITSDRGYKYLFIMYDKDVNFIHGVPIKSRKAAELV